MCIYFFVFALKIWRVSESFISLGKIFHIIGAKEDIDSVPYLTDLQLFECYTTLIVKELPCNKKIKSFTSISKTFITYITITVTNISNNIIKPYYGIIKLFQVLIIVKKKKKFSRTIIFIWGSSITLNKEAFLDFKNILLISICQNGKLIKVK